MNTKEEIKQKKKPQNTPPKKKPHQKPKHTNPKNYPKNQTCLFVYFSSVHLLSRGREFKS